MALSKAFVQLQQSHLQLIDQTQEAFKQNLQTQEAFKENLQMHFEERLQIHERLKATEENNRYFN